MKPTGMKREKVLEAILAISTGLVVLSFAVHVRPLIGAAVIVALIGLLIKPLASVIAWGWLKFAAGLGFVMSRMVLAAVFFLILVPIALLRRLLSGEHLHLKRSPGTTYYVERNHRCSPKDFENTW